MLLGRHCETPAGDDAAVLCGRARRIVVRSSPEMPFTVDGEESEGSRAVFVAHPQALDLIVPADQSAGE